MDAFSLFGDEGATNDLDSSTVNETTADYEQNGKSLQHLHSLGDCPLFP
jgi:hypothetical protein